MEKIKEVERKVWKKDKKGCIKGQQDGWKGEGKTDGKERKDKGREEEG